MHLNFKQFIVFLIIALVFLVLLVLYFVNPTFLISPFPFLNKKHQETNSECLVRVNNMEIGMVIKEVFNVLNKSKINNIDGEAYVKRNVDINIKYPSSSSFEIFNKYYSCSYDKVHKELVRQSTYNGAVQFIEGIIANENIKNKNVLYANQNRTIDAKDFLLNHASSTYKYFYNELIFGDWENSCEKNLASLCRPEDITFVASGTVQWCQNLCKKLEIYKNDKNKLITEFIDNPDKSDYIFKVAIAYRLGKSDLANQICNNLKDDKVNYDICKQIIIKSEIRQTDCQEINNFVAKYVCGT